MGDFEKGDEAVEGFGKELDRIFDSELDFRKKVDRISEELTRSVDEWNRAGDDRVICMMRTRASEYVEHLVKRELKEIASGKKVSLVSNKKSLDFLESTIKNLGWLNDVFKASINLEIAFAGSSASDKRRG